MWTALGRDKAKLENIASEINAIPIHLDVSKYNMVPSLQSPLI